MSTTLRVKLMPPGGALLEDDRSSGAQATLGLHHTQESPTQLLQHALRQRCGLRPPYSAMARNFWAKTLLRSHCPAGRPVIDGITLEALDTRLAAVTPTSRASVLACDPRSLQCLANPLAPASPTWRAFARS